MARAESFGGNGLRGSRQVTSPPMPSPVDPTDSGRVPIFGTWRAIYLSVIIVNVIAMALVYLFSNFPY